jgi:hypothetical protein
MWANDVPRGRRLRGEVARRFLPFASLFIKTLPPYRETLVVSITGIYGRFIENFAVSVNAIVVVALCVAARQIHRHARSV